MSDDRAGRLAALKARVKRRLEEVEDIEEELDDDSMVEEVTVSLKRQDEGRLARMRARRESAAATSSTRNMAMWCIAIGSILGLLTGAMLLNGNPGDLLGSSMFDPAEHANVAGMALEAETGDPVSGVDIRILSIDGKTELRSDITGSDGSYMIEQVKVEPLLLVAEKDGYKTIERVIMPDKAGEDPLTMTPGEGTVKEGSVDDLDSTDLELAVSVSTFVAGLTIIFSLIGLHAAAEAKRGSRYRRTQFLCGVSLFSRGFIIFGPLLILTGMALLAIAREQFDDQNEEEGAG